MKVSAQMLRYILALVITHNSFGNDSQSILFERLRQTTQITKKETLELTSFIEGVEHNLIMTPKKNGSIRKIVWEMGLQSYVLPEPFLGSLNLVTSATHIFKVSEGEYSFILKWGQGESARYSCFMLNIQQGKIWREDWYITGSIDSSTERFILKAQK